MATTWSLEADVNNAVPRGTTELIPDTVTAHRCACTTVAILFFCENMVHVREALVLHWDEPVDEDGEEQMS